MAESQIKVSESSNRNLPIILLVVVGTLSWGIYAFFLSISDSFSYHVDGDERPILLVVSLFAITFVGYFIGIWLAIQIPDTRAVLTAVFVFALVFRAVIALAHPFQEVDIYRYMWDGNVTAAGGSPFQFAPQTVLHSPTPNSDPDLQRLANLRDQYPSLRIILKRVHFKEYPTVYPPVSQAVFAMAAMSTPAGADVQVHLLVTKIWMIAFDMGTLILIVILLRRYGIHPGWSLTYAWCPLVLKEIANSGHLDSIAVFFTTAAVVAAAYGTARTDPEKPGSGSGTSWIAIMASAVLLALGIGAKLYPAILVPLFCFQFARRQPDAAARFRVRFALGKPAAFLAGTLILAAAINWPWMGNRLLPRNENAERTQAVSEPDPVKGLTAFLSSWEMNDFLFMLVFENLKVRTSEFAPTIENGGTPVRGFHPWFSCVPVSPRRAVMQRLAPEAFRIDTEMNRADQLMFDAGFMLTRFLTTFVFVVVAIYLAWRVAVSPNGNGFPTAVFLTIAWFWLLSPTQNPWYWIWAMPFIAFARGRTWLIVSMCAMIYYLRFYFVYFHADTKIFSTPYNGEQFFDFVVVWIEFAPFLMLLAVFWLIRKRSEDNARTAVK